MKTEITYPNGLNIVIEHPDLLESHEDNKAEFASLNQKLLLESENVFLNSIIDANNEIIKSSKIENKFLKDVIVSIKDKMSNEEFMERASLGLGEFMHISSILSMHVNIFKARKGPGVFEVINDTGGVPKQYTGTIDQITPLKSVTPIKKQREYRSKNCIKCGNSFIPTSARGNICNNCKTEPIAPTESKDLPE